MPATVPQKYYIDQMWSKYVKQVHKDTVRTGKTQV